MKFDKLMKKIISVFVLLVVYSVVQAQKMYIVLLAGQSNMSGRGIYSQLSPSDTVTYSNVLSLNKDSVWVRARHPLHWDVGDAAVGMGIQFAHRLALMIGGNVKIGLVPCAAGGTSIDKWVNNSWFGNTGNFYLYTNLIKRAQRAAKSGQIIGMIWHQGESDATSALYATYQNKLKNLFVKIRNDLKDPNLPIVAGELGMYLATNTSFPRWDSINVSINRLKTVLPYYDVVSSAGLIPNSDNLHFNAASQMAFGTRYANALFDLASGPSAVQNPKLSEMKISAGKNLIHLSTNSNLCTSVRIYDTMGRLVKSVETSEPANDIDMTTMKGVYILTISNKDGHISKKIVI